MYLGLTFIKHKQTFFYLTKTGPQGIAIVEKLNSYLFFVEQQGMKTLNKRVELRDEIDELIMQIINLGFGLNDKKDKYEDINITRRDLFKKEELS